MSNLLHLAIVSKSNKDAGVNLKLQQQVNAIRLGGVAVNVQHLPFDGLPSVMALASAISKADENKIFLRAPVRYLALLMLPMAIAKVRGKYIIVEIATPRCAAISEMMCTRTPYLRRIAGVLFLLLGGPWSLWFCSRIIQRSNESWFFSVGNQRRTVVIGNGVDLKIIKVRKKAPMWPADVLRVVGVAGVSIWHGYDRVIRAIALHNKVHPCSPRIFFSIVGEGPELDRLRLLAADLGVSDQVEFLGTLGIDDLRLEYEKSHLGIASLGLYRIGLAGASVLKSREYCAVGIPFVATGNDPDFPGDVSFRYVVSNSDDANELCELFEGLVNTTEVSTPQEIRSYAENHLDIQKKTLMMLGECH